MLRHASGWLRGSGCANFIPAAPNGQRRGNILGQNQSRQQHAWPAPQPRRRPWTVLPGAGAQWRASAAFACEPLLHRQRVVVCRRLKISNISAGKAVSFLSHCRKFVFAGEKRPRNRQNKIRPLARVCRPKQITPSSTAAAGKFAFCRANFSFSRDVRRLLQLRLNCNGRVGARRRTKSQHGPAQRTCF